MRLFGLIQESPNGQKITAQILCPTHGEAIGHFQKAARFGMLLNNKKQLDRALQVIELGGINLPYVKKMTPFTIRYEE